jgi:hypothetical protein
VTRARTARSRVLRLAACASVVVALGACSPRTSPADEPAPSPSPTGSATAPGTASPDAGLPAPDPAAADTPRTDDPRADDAPAAGAPADEPPPPDRTESLTGDVVPTIVYAGRTPDATGVEVSATVPGVVESGGTCTVVVTVGGVDHRASGPAEPDAASTSCGTIVVPAPAGAASVRLEYTAARGTGVSETIEVP